VLHVRVQLLATPL